MKNNKMKNTGLLNANLYFSFFILYFFHLLHSIQQSVLEILGCCFLDSYMHLLTCCVEWNLRNEAVETWTLEVGNVWTLLAKIVKFLWGEAIVILNDVCRNYLTANLIRNRCHDAVLYFWMHVEHSSISSRSLHHC